MLGKGFLLLILVTLFNLRTYGKSYKVSEAPASDKTCIDFFTDSLDEEDTCRNVQNVRSGHEPQAVVACDTSIYVSKPHRHPWEAGALNVSINAGVWMFDYFILKRSWCRMTMKSIRENFRTGFVWDVDDFPTNMFNHPYNGALYFNAARNCGLNYWQSTCYSFGGSLVWEYLSEREPAAINDFLSTGFGGMVLGESTLRISRLLLNDSKRGPERAMREILATAVDPMGGLVRLLHGDTWRIRSTHYLYHDFNRTPVSCSLSGGFRTLHRGSSFMKGDVVNAFDLRCNYGDYFDSGRQPFDVFRFHASLSIHCHQPTVNRVNICGKLWLSDPSIHNGRYLAYGLFQHFNYYDAKSIAHERHAPYHISEAASFGPGIIFRWVPSERMLMKAHDAFDSKNGMSETARHKADAFRLNQSVFINFVLLGGCKNDHLGAITRDYNLGSGFSVTSTTCADIPHFGRFTLNLYSMNLYTWKGYTQKDLDRHPDPLYLNTQGDKGNAWAFILNPSLCIRLPRHLSLDVGWSRYFRSMHYTYYPDCHSSYSETKVGLSYHF